VTLNVISAHRMSRWNIFFFPVSFGKMNLGHSRPLLRGLLTFPKFTTITHWLPGGEHFYTFGLAAIFWAI